MTGSALNASSSPMGTSGPNPLSELTSESPSFGFIEYFLRLSLHASTARIVQAWEVSNPQLTLSFEKRAKELLTMDAWLDVSQLPAHNSEEETVRRGFQFSASGSGIKFNVGRIKLDEPAENGIVRKRMLLCKIAVGRAYNATEDFAKIAAVPDGYDAFVIDRERVHLHNPIEACLGDAELEYILKDATQILPTFVVVFEFDVEAERRSRQKSICENCESAPAAVFCQADSANLCVHCDASLHSSKLTAKHIRTPLDAGPQTFSACRQHPDKLVEFFCPTCSRPVCVHCKMVGHHSTGDAARHKLITVAEAFRGVSEAASALDPMLDSRKQRIEGQLAAVGERVKAIESNAAEVQQQLEDLYKRALSDLKNITKKKLNVLKGDIVELHREAAEIRHLESFLEYQRTGGNATQFILDWAYHQRLRGELHAFPHFRETIDVLPDIRINGAIQIHVDAAGLPPAGVNFEGEGMRGSSLLGEARPRYTHSPSRMRVHATAVDYSSLTKMRKGTDMTESVLGSLGKA